MLKKLRIALLKRQLSAAYSDYLSAHDHLDCGNATAELMHPRTKLRGRCNSLLEQLAVLDPENCPVTRIA